MTEFTKVHQFNVFCCNHPMQLAIAEYISKEENYERLGGFYEEKRDLFPGRESIEIFCPTSMGTYFQLLDYSRITDENDVDFAIRLTKEFQLASIPVSVFYNDPEQDKVLRFCLQKKIAPLRRQEKFVKNISGK